MSADREALPNRWYCMDRGGVAMLCNDEADAREQVATNDACWPGRAPHVAVLLPGTNHAPLLRRALAALRDVCERAEIDGVPNDSAQAYLSAVMVADEIEAEIGLPVPDTSDSDFGEFEQAGGKA